MLQSHATLWKPEGGNILSPRELTAQMASHQNDVEKMGVKPQCLVPLLLLGLSSSVSLWVPDMSQMLPSPQCHGHPNKKDVDDLNPPQLSHLFSLLLNEEHPLFWCPGVAAMGVPEDDIQHIHPEHWAALLQEVRDFLALNTTISIDFFLQSSWKECFPWICAAHLLQSKPCSWCVTLCTMLFYSSP